MQRYHATGCTGAVNSGTLGGSSARDTARADSSSLSTNFSLNSRRQLQLTAYKLKSDKEPLNARLGPPDFHPQSQNCPEEILTRENVQHGYRETIDGLEDSKEISLTQVQAFSKPVVLKCKDAIRKCLRAINESRAQKRKAGQVYGVPLSDSLISKPGIFPEQRPCSEDFRKKWIEALSQQHKRLRSLADHVPHGYRKKTLFEALIKNNVPLLRATWFIKVTYLSQVRPGSSAISSGVSDKSQLSRSELWTKDVIDYLQNLLDEFFSRSNSHTTPKVRDRLAHAMYSGSIQHKNDYSSLPDSEEPSLHSKWWYVVRLLQWHHSEGLLIPSLIIDWVLHQLQEKEMFEVLQLMLPIIYGVLETITLSQTYVRTLVGIAIRFIREPSPGGSDLVDNSRRAYTFYALVEMLRYLIQAVPDTFVALDCFPLPLSVISHGPTDGGFVSKALEDAGKVKNNSTDIAGALKGKLIDSQYQSSSFDHVISAIQSRADTLAKAAGAGYPTQSMAKAVQALDKTLLHGDLKDAYKHIFEDLCSGVVGESWVSEVSPCLRSSLQWIGTVNSSFISSIFLLCEWATCDFRDFRSIPPQELKFTGQRDFSQVYIAIQLLKLKSGEWESTLPSRQRTLGVSNVVKNQQNNYIGRTFTGNTFDSKGRTKNMGKRTVSLSNLFESPGPLHDIIVCWIDQHEVQRGEGIKRLQLFVLELIRTGIFYPQAYVRQLIVSGLIDANSPFGNSDRKKRHYCVLKQLPALFMRDAFVEAGIAQAQISEAVKIYSNERRLVLTGLVSDRNYSKDDVNPLANKQKHHSLSAGENSSLGLGDQWKAAQLSSSVPKKAKPEVDLEELKTSISLFLQLPSSSFMSVDTRMDESQGSAKRTIGSVVSKFDPPEGTPGCEDCRRAKRQKLSEDKSSFLQASSPVPSDDEDNWWVRKGPKYVEPFKVDPPLKSTKQASRGRQKTGRKTQSLAQLAAARIEGSQGASTSHVCDNKISCPHHRTEVETPKMLDGIKTVDSGDIVSIGKALKKLRFVEKRTIVAWLVSVVKQLLEESSRTVSKVGQYGKPFSTADGKSSPWKLGEDELSAILYIMDICDDLPSAVRFILWLLPKVLSISSPTIHSGRGIVMLPKNVENQTCEVGEPFLLSSLRRYENILIATDLIPEVLSTTIHRAATSMVSNGRISSSATLAYARHLLKRYGNVASVIDWEKTSKATYDKRLLSELDSGRLLEGESGFPLGVPAGVEDVDEYLRQKISCGRLSRVGMSMRDIVQRHIEEVINYFLGKERKPFTTGASKGVSMEKWDDNYFIAQQIIMGLMELIKQTGGAAQEGDPSLVSSAVSAIVSTVGQSIAKLPDFTVGNNYLNYQSSPSLLNFARRILRIHLTCLCLLKEALGERQSRVFDIALATEASSALAGALAPGKSFRSQLQASSEALDSGTNISNDILNSSTKVAVVRTKIAAVSALVIGAVIHGITSLERIITVLRLKEGLDVVQFVRTTRTSSNGNVRSGGPFKVDNSVEVYVHWFRLLIGNCRTVLDGSVAELLGEPSILALLRMQRLLPVKLVFPPAYAIFAFVIWKPFVLNRYIAGREDINQLYQSLTSAIGDGIKHLPFRDVCMRDSRGFYDIISTDSTDVEFAALLELNGLDSKSKSSAFIPLRARLFLNAMIDCKMPHSSFLDEGNRASAHCETIPAQAGSGSRLVDKLVNVLDTLQPAKFHWQWVELRLLLNEQAIIEKLEDHESSLVDALRSSSPCSKEASENEKHFIEIILTRLLVRPDAASLFSELVHLFGRSLEDIVLRQAKWFLAGPDVLFGRKTIRQRLINIAESKGLSTKAHFWKPWGWSFYGLDPGATRREKKFEVSSIEEGEVVEEGMEPKRYGKGASQIEAEGSSCSQHITEKAFVELVLPCIDQSSDESGLFASDLIKQLNNIEQQISSVTRAATKQAGTPSSGNEGSVNKNTNRKGARGGSPGMARRSTALIDSAPPSPLALRASMSLRMQFVLRLLPLICADGEPSARNLRLMLASVILRLLGSRVVYEDLNLSFCPTQLKREAEIIVESPPVFAELFGESLFDRLLLVLHGLLSSSQPSWLRSKSASKSPREFSKSFSGLDREAAENLQNELGGMQLPDTIRWRIQTAMPMLCPSVRYTVPCQPPTLPIEAISSVQPSSVFIPGTLNLPQRSVPTARGANMVGKPKPAPISQDFDIEIDPWTLLEDGAGSGPSTSSSAVLSNDHSNLRAVSWLKGTVRVRRTDLTYVGAVDDDS